MGLYYSVSSSLILVNTNTVDILLTVSMNYVKPVDSISPVMASSQKILLAPATDEQVLCDPYRCHSRYGNNRDVLRYETLFSLQNSWAVIQAIIQRLHQTFPQSKLFIEYISDLNLLLYSAELVCLNLSELVWTCPKFSAAFPWQTTAMANAVRFTINCHDSIFHGIYFTQPLQIRW